MLVYPQISPVIFSIGSISVYWYGLMYLLAFTIAWILGCYKAQKEKLLNQEQVSDLIFYGAMGVVIGGRLGYMLFYYYPHNNWQDISAIFKIWQGGMSFHGGLLGVIFSIWLFARKIKKSFWQLTDFVAPLVPLGLAAGRLGNFINGELWGRVTTAPWGMIFPHVDNNPRHPSQLYEAFLEGFLLFGVLWLYSNCKASKRIGATSGMFLLSYGVLRCFAEVFREPDSEIGYLLGFITMGQILSLPLILLGTILLVSAYKYRYK